MDIDLLDGSKQEFGIQEQMCVGGKLRGVWKTAEDPPWLESQVHEWEWWEEKGESKVGSY